MFGKGNIFPKVKYERKSKDILEKCAVFEPVILNLAFVLSDSVEIYDKETMQGRFGEDKQRV